MVGLFVDHLLNRFSYSLAPHPLEDWYRNRETLRAFLQNADINCVLDVGANRGQFAELLRGIGYSERIVSFEPVRATYEMLLAKTVADENWWPLRYALGACDGEAAIHVAEESVFSSFLAPREDSQERFPGNRAASVESVPLRRLDSVFPECVKGLAAPRVYLKLDTQGLDLEVVRGAAACLPQIEALQTELPLRAIYEGMNSFCTSLAAFAGYGFEPVDFMPVTRERAGGCLIEVDCIMTRRMGATA